MNKLRRNAEYLKLLRRTLRDFRDAQSWNNPPIYITIFTLVLDQEEIEELRTDKTY